MRAAKTGLAKPVARNYPLLSFLREPVGKNAAFHPRKVREARRGFHLRNDNKYAS